MRPPYKVIWNDTETTGLTERHGVIQWSAKVFIDGVEKDRIDLKIQPLKGHSIIQDDLIEDDALEANHITREELFDSSRFTPKVAHQAIVGLCSRYVDKFDPKDKFIWHGFNSRFDMDRTRDLFVKCGDKFFGSWFWFPPADIMGLAINLLTKERARLFDFKQKTVWEYLHPDEVGKYKDEEWHDAMFDIDRCRDIQAALRARLQKGIITANKERDQFKLAVESQQEEIKRQNAVIEKMTEEIGNLEAQLATANSR